MSRVTYSDLKRTFPEEKKSVESIYGIIVPVRKISYLVTIICLSVKMTAFCASVISMIIALLACVCLMVPNDMVRIIGVLLVPIWHIFDCVDGNIARYTKTSSDFGSAVDAICGYFIIAFLPISLAVAGYNTNFTFWYIRGEYLLIFGGIASTASVMIRLIHQKFAFSAKVAEEKLGVYIEKGEKQYELTGFQKLRKMMDVELGPVGVPMFFLFFSVIYKVLYGWLAVYYFFYYVLSLLVITFYYLRRCKRGK